MIIQARRNGYGHSQCVAANGHLDRTRAKPQLIILTFLYLPVLSSSHAVVDFVHRAGFDPVVCYFLCPVNTIATYRAKS